jgi:hypothetical protein
VTCEGGWSCFLLIALRRLVRVVVAVFRRVGEIHQVGLDCIDQSLESELVLVGRVAPGGEVDVIETEDDERWVAGLGKRWHDRQLAGESRERELITASVFLTHGMRR